jgi:U3 small nucleolar RNA-associated protein 19
VNLVGAFIKKLSRMSLTCPPGDLPFLILFSYNLLIRHQNCKILIHNSSKNKNSKQFNSVLEDPFDVNELDYNKSKALKSSLWEIQSLKNHYLSNVSKQADKINSINTIEYSLDDVFENNSYEALIEQELDPTKATPNCAIYFGQLELKNRRSLNDNKLIHYNSDISSILVY